MLLGRVEALSPRVDAITIEAKRVALRRQVEDVLLEVLYAVERKAMSPRLSRYAQDQRTRWCQLDLTAIFDSSGPAGVERVAQRPRRTQPVPA